MISLGVSYNTIKKNTTLGDFGLADEEAQLEEEE